MFRQLYFRDPVFSIYIILWMSDMDHPCITSGYFWHFCTLPIHIISINTVPNVSKNDNFLDPPTQSFCWRNIGMVPYQLGD